MKGPHPSRCSGTNAAQGDGPAELRIQWAKALGSSTPSSRAKYLRIVGARPIHQPLTIRERRSILAGSWPPSSRLASPSGPWVKKSSLERQKVHDKLHRGGMGQGATDTGDGERVGPGQRDQARGHREGGGRGGRVGREAAGGAIGQAAHTQRGLVAEAAGRSEERRVGCGGSSR